MRNGITRKRPFRAIIRDQYSCEGFVYRGSNRVRRSGIWRIVPEVWIKDFQVVKFVSVLGYGLLSQVLQALASCRSPQREWVFFHSANQIFSVRSR